MRGLAATRSLNELSRLLPESAAGLERLLKRALPPRLPAINAGSLAGPGTRAVTSSAAHEPSIPHSITFFLSERAIDALRAKLRAVDVNPSRALAQLLELEEASE